MPRSALARASDSFITSSDDFGEAPRQASHDAVSERLSQAPGSSSPALDLQRRLGEAALRGFYAPQVTPRRASPRRIALVVGIGAGVWALCFGAGAALLG